MFTLIAIKANSKSAGRKSQFLADCKDHAVIVYATLAAFAAFAVVMITLGFVGVLK
jgi:hypothetical protein